MCWKFEWIGQVVESLNELRQVVETFNKLWQVVEYWLHRSWPWLLLEVCIHWCLLMSLTGEEKHFCPFQNTLIFGSGLLLWIELSVKVWPKYFEINMETQDPKYCLDVFMKISFWVWCHPNEPGTCPGEMLESHSWWIKAARDQDQAAEWLMSWEAEGGDYAQSVSTWLSRKSMPVSTHGKPCTL